LNSTINSENYRTFLRVLVAEDNPTNLRIAQITLKPLVLKFDPAENGLVAFEKFKANKYDVIFMDVHMPVMDGYEATKKIRAFEKDNHLDPVKIVAVTGSAMEEDEKRCISCGMDQYLSKPFDRDDLIIILQKLNLKNKE
jgi:CheY-like chemotaxis protein